MQILTHTQEHFESPTQPKYACFWTVRLDLVKTHTSTVKIYKPHREKPELESNTEPSLHEVTVLRGSSMVTLVFLLDFDGKIPSCTLLHFW